MRVPLLLITALLLLRPPAARAQGVDFGLTLGMGTVALDGAIADATLLGAAFGAHFEAHAGIAGWDLFGSIDLGQGSADNDNFVAYAVAARALGLERRFRLGSVALPDHRRGALELTLGAGWAHTDVRELSVDGGGGLTYHLGLAAVLDARHLRIACVAELARFEARMRPDAARPAYAAYADPDLHLDLTTIWLGLRVEGLP